MHIIDTMSHSAVGERIREARIEAGLTGAELAKAVGVTGVTVWRWERRGAVPKTVTLFAIASACGCSPESLSGSDPAAQPPA